jgi:hypothetical protein
MVYQRGAREGRAGDMTFAIILLVRENSWTAEEANFVVRTVSNLRVLDLRGRLKVSENDETFFLCPSFKILISLRLGWGHCVD